MYFNFLVCNANFLLTNQKKINQKLNLGLDVDLERSKHLHIQQALRLEEEKLQLQKADNLASKFTAALEIPKIVQPPLDFKPSGQKKYGANDRTI